MRPESSLQQRLAFREHLRIAGSLFSASRVLTFKSSLQPCLSWWRQAPLCPFSGCEKSAQTGTGTCLRSHS